MENMELTVAEGIVKYLEESNIRPVTMEMLKGCAKNKSFELINNIKINKYFRKRCYIQFWCLPSL